MADTLNSHYHIAFLRHGESIGNAEERFQGQSDFPLSPLGRAQARALASRWKEEGFTFNCIVTSPLSRAAETAQIIGSALGSPVETEPLWMERHNGQFSGMRHVEIRERFPSIDNWGLYQNFAETGEGDWELYLRAGQALHALMRKAPGRYLVVSHGGTLNQVMYALMGIAPHPRFHGARFRFDNTGFTLTDYDPTSHTWRINCMNDHAHIKNVKADDVTDI